MGLSHSLQACTSSGQMLLTVVIMLLLHSSTSKRHLTVFGMMVFWSNFKQLVFVVLLIDGFAVSYLAEVELHLPAPPHLPPQLYTPLSLKAPTSVRFSSRYI